MSTQPKGPRTLQDPKGEIADLRAELAQLSGKRAGINIKRASPIKPPREATSA